MKLNVTGLSCSYQEHLVLENLNMTVREGEFVTILGPSGCGKSTFLNILAGVCPRDDGRVLVDGREVSGLSPYFAYMPQQDLLMPWKTILDNVTLYGRIHGGRKELRERARDLFPVFGLQGYEDRYPRELSGGMRQRAAFLRTALCSAEILLLDEPFGALDVITRGDMQEWLLGIRKTLGRATVLVTHDIDEAIYLSDRILILNGSPACFRQEFQVEGETRTREWLFDQTRLHGDIFRCLKESPAEGGYPFDR